MVLESMRSVFLIGLIGAFLGLTAGCTKPCMELQQIMCTCEGRTQDARSVCEDAAKAQAELAPPKDGDEVVCESLLEGCQAIVDAGCDQLQTREGKRACGLAID